MTQGPRLGLSVDMIGCEPLSLAWEHYKCKDEAYHASWQQPRLQPGHQSRVISPCYREAPRVFPSKTPDSELEWHISQGGR
jgi:hypothetical protein